jgi:hypothetical protein
MAGRRGQDACDRLHAACPWLTRTPCDWLTLDVSRRRSRPQPRSIGHGRTSVLHGLDVPKWMDMSVIRGRQLAGTGA